MPGRACLSFLVLLSGASPAQSPAAKPVFDIADVHVSPRLDWVKNPAHAMQGGFLTGDRYELRRATMLDLIRMAYNVDADKVSGGPSWLDYDRFEIVAKTKPGTRPEQLRLMLQALIEDRFRLAVKPDTRPAPVYVLSKGKGELKFSATADRSNLSGCHDPRPVLDGGIRYSKIECRNITMDAFAERLRRLLATPIADLPVVNHTGLEGGWDIDLVVRARIITDAGPANGPGLDAVKQLGLTLEPGTVPQPVLAVERVTEQPSANPPGVAESLPPLPPPQFEVASIKWPCNDNMSRAPRFESAGRVTATCMPLMSLIRQAFGLALFEEPAGVPKWLADDSTTSHNISIFAKAPANLTIDAQNNAQARGVLRAMLRALLIERYQIKFHYEDRPVDARTLAAVKPKLAKADPTGRTGCKRERQQQEGRALMVQLVCRNMTMAQFAEQLTAYDTDIYYPVLDATGLDGGWDFTLNYDAMASLNERFPQFARAAPGPDGQASEPSGGLSFQDAIEKQLGLKLEVHKRPEPVLVIDHMEEKPIEN
jgi:uncharacterized protein (TIGR03435 family)